MKSDTRPVSPSEAAYSGFYSVIAPLIMGSGVGDGHTTACVMAQAATIDALRKGLTLDKPTDEMECACPVLRRMAIRFNDTNWWKSNEERTEHLRPLIPLLLDSRGDKALTDRRGFRVADACVRELTPMRLDWISANTKSDKVRAANKAGAKQLRELAPITDYATAMAAREVCQTLRSSAHTHTHADASAYAHAHAYAYAYASAYAHAHAYAYAQTSASASAHADASADAYADAHAYASADAHADAHAQKLKYREAALTLFREVAAMK